MNIGILEPDGFSEEAIRSLHMIGHVSFYREGTLESFLCDIDILFIRLRFFIGQSFLEMASKLSIICTPTTGLNHIDLSEAMKRGIHVLSLRGKTDFLQNIYATPEHTFGLVIALLRNYKSAFIRDENAVWNRDLFRGHEIHDNRIGLIGYGRIGKTLSHYFQLFGAHVVVYDINSVSVPQDVEVVQTIPDLIEKSNIIVLCASYSGDNDKMISDPLLRMMKGKYFVNTARGELVDEAALWSLIDQSWFSGVAIDVLADETNQSLNIGRLVARLSKHNVIITPHIGGCTHESMKKTEIFLVGELVDFMSKNDSTSFHSTDP